MATGWVCEAAEAQEPLPCRAVDEVQSNGVHQVKYGRDRAEGLQHVAETREVDDGNVRAKCECLVMDCSVKVRKPVHGYLYRQARSLQNAESGTGERETYLSSGQARWPGTGRERGRA